jgi:PAS domain-containing protein
MRDNTESEISLEDELIASDKVRVVDELIASDKVCAPVCEETDDQEIVLDLENISKHEIVDAPVVSSNLSENTTKNAELIVETVIEQIAAEIIAETEAGGVIESDDHAEEFDEVEEEEVEVEEDEDVEVEVEEEDEEEEVEVEEDVEEEEAEIEEEEEEEEEEEAGVYEIEINGTRYFTTNEQDGVVYEAIGEDDVGDEIGKFVKGKLVLF